MKKLFVCLMLLGILYAPALHAQDIGNCSIIMFNKKTEENGKTNLLELFSGFNAKAINSKSGFQTMTIFQGYTPNTEHSYKIVLTNMKDDSVIDSFDNERPFTLESGAFRHSATMYWSVTFPEAGNYCITVYVNDRIAQKLYFGVGN